MLLDIFLERADEEKTRQADFPGKSAREKNVPLITFPETAHGSESVTLSAKHENLFTDGRAEIIQASSAKKKFFLTDKRAEIIQASSAKNIFLTDGRVEIIQA